MNEFTEYGLPFALAAIFCLVEGLFLVAVLFAGLAIRCTLDWFHGRTTPGVTHGR